MVAHVEGWKLFCSELGVDPEVLVDFMPGARAARMVSAADARTWPALGSASSEVLWKGAQAGSDRISPGNLASRPARPVALSN